MSNDDWIRFKNQIIKVESIDDGFVGVSIDACHLLTEEDKKELFG